VAAAPVEFEQMERSLGFEPEMKGLGEGMAMAAFADAAPAPARARRAINREALQQAAPVTTTGEALGELFQYVIGTPVTVGRGHSAMVPIVSSSLSYRKDLLYNGAKMPTHPVATLRLENETGLTLERGPVTVIEEGDYVGEAVMPFTVADGEMVVPYAVELAIKVREETGSSRQLRGVNIQGAYLQFEEWDVRWREYQLNNRTSKEVVVLVEHPRTNHYDLFETTEPQECTDEHLRFDVEVAAQGEARLRVQERRLLRRREELKKQSYQGLQRYLRQGLLDQKAYEKVAEVLGLWEKVSDCRKEIQEVEQERKKLYKAQDQVQGNMGALSTSGKEGALRARYVEQLEASEDQLRSLDKREAGLKAEIERLEKEIKARIGALK
jgi:hypothetical protein